MKTKNTFPKTIPIIGLTRSGQDIYNQFSHVMHQDYSFQDHNDAILSHYQSIKKCQDQLLITSNKKDLFKEIEWHKSQADSHNRAKNF
jgi:hypothetical protein